VRSISVVGFSIRCRSLDLKDVVARTGGVPLFVEDVTRLLLEFGEAAE
jgi:hypothetical protein